MAIRIDCTSCRAAFRVPDQYTGKRGKCPTCGTLFRAVAREAAPARGRDEDEEGGTYELAGRVSVGRVARRSDAASGAVAVASAVTRATRSPAQILAAFEYEIEPVRPSATYRLGILVVAAGMVLLPLVYMGIIAAAGFAVVYHATHHYTVFETLKVRAAVIAYFGPLVAGGALVAFMIKPLFAKPAKRQKTRSLDPSKEPLLFAFVDGVCQAVGSPRPSRIDVDCQANASASFAGGPFHVFNKDLVLTIGLPLAAGLDLRQFAGVLAHEFGHFSQGAGMRVSNLIRAINFWFTRVVYERDAWDEQFDRLIAQAGGLFFFIGLLTKFAIWITRRILWVLMMAGHTISGFLLRQMEFDADRYEARMVGGTVFESTARRLAVLNLASQGAFADLANTWKEGKLADDLPKLVLANVAQIPPNVIEVLDKQLETGKTGLFDTHPADRDRIARAHAEGDDAVFTLGGPATDLFRDFDGLARATTFDFYRSLFGKSLSQDVLAPVAEVVQGTEALQEANQAVARFFLGSFHPLRPIALPPEPPGAPGDPRAAREALVRCRTDLQKARADYAAALERHGELIDRLAALDAATCMHKTGFRVKASDLKLSSGSPEAVADAVEQAEDELGALTAPLGRFEENVRRRLLIALGLLELDALAARVPDSAQWRAEVRTLYPVALQLNTRVLPTLQTAMRARQALDATLEKLKGHEKNESLHNAIFRASRVLRDQLQELSWKLGATPYPFDHANTAMTLSRYALPNVPTSHEAIGEIVEASADAFNSLAPLQARLLGRLALAAEEVERALGLPPLQPPPEAAEAERARLSGPGAQDPLPKIRSATLPDEPRLHPGGRRGG